ncbi:MAG: NTP transferase domain-containing protein [Halanaeroarchaeum sp.]
MTGSHVSPVDGLVMAGGKGTRLAADEEKPLFEVCGVPMIDRVLDAIRESNLRSVYTVVSPHTPNTARHVDTPTLETPGDGYVADLQVALERVQSPVLTVGADLPLLDADGIDWVLQEYRRGSEGDRPGSLTVCVPAERKTDLGCAIDESRSVDGRRVVPAGVNIVGKADSERRLLTDDVRFAVNVNHLNEARIAAEHLCEE